MNVRHLGTWLARAAAACAAGWRLFVSGGQAPALQPVAAAASISSAGLARPRSDLASSHWMEDARRLHGRVPFAHLGTLPPGIRPHASARPQPRDARPPRPARSPRDEQLREILRDPRWAAFDGHHGTPPPPRLPRGIDPRLTHRPGEGVISRPMTTPSPSPTGDAQPAPLTEREQRRLVFMRELVGRGVYNEGFAPAQVPDQYRPKPPDADGRA